MGVRHTFNRAIKRNLNIQNGNGFLQFLSKLQ